MAHYKRSYRSKRKTNTIWQPWTHSETVQIPAGSDAHSQINVAHAIVTPGRNSYGNDEAFDEQVRLERIRGMCLHDANGSSNDYTIYATMALVKVPAGLILPTESDSLPDLFANDDGEDYPFYVNALCGTGDRTPADNYHDVDNKAKRRVDPGDVFYMIGSYKRDKASQVTAINVDIAFSLRFLWALIGT